MKTYGDYLNEKKYENEVDYILKSTYEGYDGKTYKAIYRATKDEDGNVYNGYGEYYDPKQRKWIDLEGDGDEIADEMKIAIKNKTAKIER